MNKKNILFWIIGLILLTVILTFYSNFIENKILYNYNPNNLNIKYSTQTNENNYTFMNTKGSPQGSWYVNKERKSTYQLLEELKIGENWGAIENISEKEYNRIKEMVQYMGYTEHIDENAKCYYNNGNIKYSRIIDTYIPHYHQGLFGKEEWGNVISGTNIANPDNSSTFNKNGCHIYTLAYALSNAQKQVINPPEALVIGWYSGFWNDGMGPSENVENLRTYLGINAITVSDNKENAKTEIDEILKNQGVVIVYLSKPFSFGNFHWVCITDKVNDNGIDKYRIWTSTNMNQIHQVYTFDYLYSKRVFEDWVRMGIMP